MRKPSFLLLPFFVVLLLSACATTSEKYTLGDPIPAGYGVLVTRSWANYPVDVELQNPTNPLRWKYFNLKPGAGSLEYRLVPVGDYKFESIVVDRNRMFLEIKKNIRVQDKSISYLGDWLVNVTQMKESSDNILRGGDVRGIQLPIGAVYFAVVPRCDDFRAQSEVMKMHATVTCVDTRYPIDLDDGYVKQFIESQNNFWRQ